MIKNIEIKSRVLFFCLFALFFLACFSGTFFAEQVISFPELQRPDSIIHDSDRLYIVDSTTIFIYSAKDFKLSKKFGTVGEGPGEFAKYVHLFTHKDGLIINSWRKVSFFTRDGDFRDEKRIVTIRSGNYQKIGDKYIGVNSPTENNIIFDTVNFYDAELKKVKEIFRSKCPYQPGKTIDMVTFGVPPHYFLCDNKIFIENKKNSIEVFDKTGEKIYSIKPACNKVKITKDHKKMYIDNYKKDPNTKYFYEVNKKRMTFSEFFPIIRESLAADGKVYVLTYREEGDKSEFFVYDTKGKFLKSIMVTLAVKEFMNPPPFAIKNNKLYQLVENLDKEQWELHISAIE